MYGRADAGVICTIAIHQPAATINDPTSAHSCTIRLPIFGGPASRYASPMPGATRKTCSSLARKPAPSSAPHSTSQRVRPSSSARVIAHAAATMQSVSSASGLLKRNMSAATGVSASTSPASRPATAPNHRFTAA